jgi:3-dehydroquinate synthase
MALAMRYSLRLGLMNGEDVARAEALIAASDLSTRIPDLAGGPYRPGALTDTMRQDKKARGGKVPLILARGIGKSFIQPDADLEDLKSFLETETSVTAS